MSHEAKRSTAPANTPAPKTMDAAKQIAPPPFQLKADPAKESGGPVGESGGGNTTAELHAERAALQKELSDLQFDSINYRFMSEYRPDRELTEQDIQLVANARKVLAEKANRAKEIQDRLSAISNDLAKVESDKFAQLPQPYPEMDPYDEGPKVTSDPGFDFKGKAAEMQIKLANERIALQREFDRLRESYQRNQVFVEWQSEEGNPHADPDRLAAAKKKLQELDKKGLAIQARLKVIGKDMDTLKSQDPSTVKGVLERNSKEFASVDRTEIDAEGYSFEDNKVSRNTDVKKDRATEGDLAIERAKMKTSELDLEGNTHTTGDTEYLQIEQDGEVSKDTKVRNERKIDYKNGAVTFGESDTHHVTKKDGGDTVSKDASGKEKTWGREGYARRDWEEKIKDGRVDKKESTLKVTRGGGQLGLGKQWKGASGETGKNEKNPQGDDVFERYDPNAKDKSGELEKGTEWDATVGGGAVFGPDGVGAFAQGEGGATKKHGDGMETGAKLGAGGKTLVTVKPVPGSSPKRYAIHVIISVNGKLTLSAGQEFKSGAKFTGSYGRGHEGVTSFSRELSESEAKAYLDAIGRAEAGKPTPDHPEMGIIATGVNEGWDVAGKALEQMGEMTGEGIRGMKNGDEFSDTDKDSEDFSFGGSFKGMGATFGFGSDHEKKKGVKIVNGKAVLSVQVTDTERLSAGASLANGVASGGVTYGSSDAHIHVITVTLDPGHPNFDQLVTKIQSVNSYSEMVALQQSHPEIQVNFGNGRTRTESLDTKLDVGPVGVNISDSASHSRMDNADGSTDFKGSNKLGGGVTGLGLTYGTSSEESLSAHVDKDGNARMDLSEVNKETDLGKSLDSAVDSITNNPGSFFGQLLTGSAKPLKDSTNIPGTMMTNHEVDMLVALAHDPTKWSSAVASPRLREDWLPMRAAIKRAGGDRRRIAELMTEFVGKRGNGRREALETALRTAGGKDDEGYRYEFPEGTEHLKPKYEKWVHTKPQGQVAALYKAGQMDEALRVAKELLNELESLKGAMMNASVKDKSRFGDMITHLSGPQSELQKMINRLENPDASEEELTEKDSKKDYQRLLHNCKGYRHQFRQSLQRATEMRSDGRLDLDETIENVTLVNQSGELMEQWEADFAKLKVLAQEYGFGGSAKEWTHYAPDSAWLSKMKSGEAPLGFSKEKEKEKDAAHSKAVEDAQYRDHIQADNDKIVARVHAMNPWNLEYKARQEQKKHESEKQKQRQAIVAEWLPILKSAKHSAAMKAGKCNGMNARKQTALIKPAAKQKWGAAFGSLNQGNVATSLFQSMLHSQYHPNYMRSKAQTAHSHYLKALDLFTEGNRLQG